MNPDLLSLTSNYLNHALGCQLDALLQPISPSQPGGVSLKGSDLLRRITQARSHDDPGLDRGVWQHDLRRADWPLVSQLCLDGLRRQSKDLQLATFLAEARLECDGIAALTPMLGFLRELLLRLGPHLHPQADGADQSHRANLMRSWLRRSAGWLRVAPWYVDAHGAHGCWAQWEATQADAQRASRAADEDPATQGLSALQNEIDAWPVAAVQDLYANLNHACWALAELGQTMERLWQQDAPTVATMDQTLRLLLAWADSQLRRRGVPVANDFGAAVHAQPAMHDPHQTQEPTAEDAAATSPRDHAYAALAHIAWELRELEPHSPVPYLLNRALEWGQMNTAELYQEVFIRQGGQISIFELLGLELPAVEKS